MFLLVATPAWAEEITAINRVETYRARWWGTEGSEFGRPIYSVTRLDNGPFRLHFAMVPGRPLADYTLPYWRIRSGFSLVDDPAELAHQCEAIHTVGDATETLTFVPHSGFDLGQIGNADILAIKNRTSASQEGRERGVANPLLMEHFFVVPKGERYIQVLARFTNSGTQELQRVEPRILYEQRFNWSDFGMASNADFERIEAPFEGTGTSFFAYSEGMNRGYEIVAGRNTRLDCRLSQDWNHWTVELNSEPADLKPGESTILRYQIRFLREIPTEPEPVDLIATSKNLETEFRHIVPAEFKKAPVDLDRRVSLPNLLAEIDRPKVRGLNLRAKPDQALKDLETLEDWDCNLVITSIDDPNRTAERIEKGHQLGMEMFLAGEGNFKEGLPSFDSYYAEPRSETQQADSHGQDEDHYYWESIPPTRDFMADFGKPMALATQEERVLYWASCFRDKWLTVLKTVRESAPKGGVWFYTPSPGVAHVDALDFHKPFFEKIAEIGEPLTVFPFYYGIEYNQAEYMVRRWKDAGASRVVFLPMRGFLTHPSQFLRVITASRRGGADGACGFNFAVGEAEPKDAWQWQSVLLAAEANFPTSEMEAYCLLEEPAELLEAMAERGVMLEEGSSETMSEAERIVQSLGRGEPDSG
ncbi:MAG: hypothetical protein KC964_11745, partial [Candidatus Omnitrophica bacterium]|nr:hypothetical protein [Candidatus Omnitrophota bacterium]